MSIDERRAKFRADLVSHGVAARKDSERPLEEQMETNPHAHHDWVHRSSRYKTQNNNAPKKLGLPDRLAPGRAEHREGRSRHNNDETTRYRSHSRAHSHSSVASVGLESSARDGAIVDAGDASSLIPPIEWDDDLSSDGDEDDQDIQELWFPGGHADIGGGWDVKPGEVPLSHIPLVWIVHEAEKSGLAFDPEKMESLDCLDDSRAAANDLPTIEVSTSASDEKIEPPKIELGNRAHFKNILLDTATNAVLHDCLRFKEGLSWGGVVRWRLMEYLPFRRLDLGPDGKWKPIRWYVYFHTCLILILMMNYQATSTRRSAGYA